MPGTKEEIKKEVVDELYWDSRIDAANVQVEVTNGTVRLGGTVPSNLSRQAAVEDTWTVPGVTFVEDELEVESPTVTPRPADEEVDLNVRLALDWNPHLSIEDRVVQVTDGRVELKGTVDALWKKAYADELLLDIPGVLQIENKLTVVPGRDIVDKEIAADIVGAFDRHALLVNNELDVRVNDGHVSLSGAVPNWVVRRAADEVAHYTPGVRSVTNDIQVLG